MAGVLQMVMKIEDIKIQRLARQHLLAPANSQTVVKDLCGLQAQYFGHAIQALALRTNEINMEGLVKSWTNRGTMHLFSSDDLDLFFHEGRTYFLRPQDTMESDAFITARRKAYFGELVLDAISRGMDDREALKAVCAYAGMTEGESKSLFDPWGGLIRALCETGKLCHKAQEKKAYQLCPEFAPMPEEAARIELTRRYFTHFGPATVKDAAYFFGTTQAKVKAWLNKLPVSETVLDGRTYFFIEYGFPYYELPNCLFLAGFDQLMLGYEKTESLFLPKTYMRDIFTLSGIVRPVILIDGNVAGWWNLKNHKLNVTLFEDAHTKLVAESADKQWADIRKINFQ